MIKHLAFKLIHFFYGLLSALVLYHSMLYGFINIAWFHIYEFVEYAIIKDKPYIDLREFYAGFALASAYLFLWQ